MNMKKNEISTSVGRPAINALFSMGYRYLEDLAEINEKELLAIHGVGPKAIRILRQQFSDLNVKSKL